MDFKAATISLLITVMLSSCGLQNSVEANWISTTGKVKKVEEVIPQKTAESNSWEQRTVVTYEYRVGEKSYEGTQSVSINVPRRFKAGEVVKISVDTGNPYKSRIELPPEPQPDRTGMKWRVPDSTRSSFCP